MCCNLESSQRPIAGSSAEPLQQQMTKANDESEIDLSAALPKQVCGSLNKQNIDAFVTNVSGGEEKGWYLNLKFDYALERGIEVNVINVVRRDSHIWTLEIVKCKYYFSRAEGFS